MFQYRARPRLPRVQTEQKVNRMMSTSRFVTSNQEGIHPDLDFVVEKHLSEPYQKPIAKHTQFAFEHLCKWLASQEKPLILDSGCGVGQSSDILAKQNPHCAVVGVDQSEHRLQQRATQREQGDGLNNRLLLQADCVDLWRLLVQEGIEVARHCIFYPNPWPKKQHLKRRWQGHPVFPALLQLSPTLELRTNWDIYAQEFARALEVAGCLACEQGVFTPDEQAGFMTPFEEKYHLSGQTLYTLTASLS